MPSESNASLKHSIAAWLSVPDGENAVDFYKRAFGAAESYRLEDPGGGIVVRLSIKGAEFWISQEPTDNEVSAPLGGGTIRLILILPNPDAVFAQAIAAGGTEIFPVGEDHGWRLGRLADPFGLHWEIGYQIA